MKFMLSLVLFCGVFNLAQAQRVKKLKLVEFVNKAVKFSKKNGFEKSCKEFNDGKKFKDGEFYIFAYDYNGVVLCHGAKKNLIGKNLLEFKDKKGNTLIKDLIAAAKEDGGFVRYVWPLPNSEKLADKLGYAKKVDDKYWIGSGIYYVKD